MSKPPHDTFRIVVPMALCGTVLACVAAPPGTVVRPAPARIPTAAAAPAPAVAEQPPLLRLPADVRPLRYTLALEIVPARPRFRGTADIEVRLGRPRQVIWLHGRDLHVTRASVDAPGGAVAATFEEVAPEGVARLTLARPVGPGTATIHLAWDAAWGRLSGLYLAHGAGETYAATQFEAIDARRAFPGFDEPGFKTPFDVTLTVPATDVAVANTPVRDETPLAGGLKRVRFATSRPLPTYLIAWAVGPFDVVTPPPLPPNEVRRRPLPVRGIAPKGRGAELAYALSAANELLVALERYLGIPYPYAKLDHIAVPEFGPGAMENAGAIVYKESVLLFKQGVSSEDARIEIAHTTAHEMAHEWFGDLVTLPWWTDIWLNESFATWMQRRTVQTWKPEVRAAIGQLVSADRVMTQDALANARAIRQPLERMAEVEGQFDNMSYSKGAAVLGMFERWVGAEAFRTGIHDYLAAHAHGTGSTAEFLAAISRASGKAVVGPFQSFLDQSGVPLVKAQTVCGARGARVELGQSRYLRVGSQADAGRTWQVPVCVRYGEGDAAHEACTLLTGKTGTLALPGGRCPAWVLPNADGAGYYRWSLAPADLRKLRTAGQARLTVRERLSLGQNLSAAIDSAALPFADVMAALEPLARDPEPEVAELPMDVITFARNRLVPATLEPRVEAFARRLYAPVLRRLGWKPRPGEGLAERRLRVAVIEFLAFTARDPAVRRQAARLGRAFAGLADGRFHPEAVSPDLAGPALAVAVQEGDAAFLDALVARLGTTEEAEVRGRILEAVGSVRDPELSARALALVFDPRLRKHEVMSTLFSQAHQRETREAAWTFLKGHFDPLVSKVGGHHSSYALFLAGGFCDADHAAQVEAFFQPRLTRLPGARRALAQTLERIRLCRTLKDAQQQSARVFFERRAARR